MTDDDPIGIRARLHGLRGRNADLAAVLALTILADLFVLAPVLRATPGRLLFGLAALLIAPGYAAVAALFPRSADGTGEEDRTPTGIERLALAVAASALLVPVLGIGLTVAGVGVGTRPLLVGLNAVVFGGVGSAALRRSRRPGDERPDRGAWGSSAGESRTSFAPAIRDWTALDVGLAVLLVAALATVGFAAVAPSGGHTELYLLTENESGDLVAGDYPSNVTVGENRSLTLGVHNNWKTAADYTVVVQFQRVATNGTADGEASASPARSAEGDVRVLERTETHRFTPSLAPNETWHRRHTVSPPFAGERVRLVYLLYRDDPPREPTVSNADREVHLWLDVSETSGQ